MSDAAPPPPDEQPPLPAEPDPAPPGAHCHAHPDREAHLTCPRCKRHHCIFCFQMSVGLCAHCLAEDPASAVPPLAFETDAGNPLWRVASTLATAFTPARTAPAFATPDVAPALRFALWTALPLAFAAGIIPHTHTLMFGDGFGIRPIGDPTRELIALDVMRAGLIQSLVSAFGLLGMAIPFASLMGAFGGEHARSAAWRVLLYRGWLLPVGSLLVAIAFWAAPAPPDPTDAEAVLRSTPVALGYGVRFASSVLLLLAMGFTARLAGGVAFGWSLVVVVVAAVVGSLVDLAATDLLRLLWPPPSLG